MLERPKLFLDNKEFAFGIIFFIIILSVRLYIIYGEYLSFISKPFYFTKVEVLQQYKKEKNGKSYTTLRLYSRELNLDFFTTTYQNINLLDKIVRVKLFPSKEITFFNYLSTSYIKLKINRVDSSPNTLKSNILDSIAKEHNKPIIIEFYQAIFLAKPVSKELRESVSKLGISHLIALSGFHLAILWGILFFLLNIIYKFFQQYYFPYRFNLVDIGFLVLIILGYFVWFVGSPASLLRSYIMMSLGWIILILGMELLSFTFLATAVMILLIIFPKMLLSLAFWFSVLGVFYIFLILKYFNRFNKFITTAIISFGIFILMSPIVHTIFPITSIYQLYSPLLSLAFTIFYPISIGSHIVGIGYIFDNLLLNLLYLDDNTTLVKIPIYYGVGYIILSIGAVYSRWIFYLLFIIASIIIIFINF